MEENLTHKHGHGMEFFGSTTVGERGQVVIPVEAREKLSLDKGEKILVMGFGKNLMLMKFENFQKMAEKLARKQEEIERIIRES